MDTHKQINALQDLIIRLQDAEERHREIARATQYPQVQSMMHQRAEERHKMHQALAMKMKNLGGEPKVKTSVLGELHQAWIDLKLNNFSDEYESITAEIKRGSERLIEDYEEVMKQVDFQPDIRQIVNDQHNLISRELKTLPTLQEKIPADV